MLKIRYGHWSGTQCDNNLSKDCRFLADGHMRCALMLSIVVRGSPGPFGETVESTSAQHTSQKSRLVWLRQAACCTWAGPRPYAAEAPWETDACIGSVYSPII